MRRFPWFSFPLLLSAPAALAAEHRIEAPGGGLSAVISDDGGLHHRVEADSQKVVIDSPLGLGFKDGVKLGPSALITNVTRTAHDGWWDNNFGNRRKVRDRWRQVHLVLTDRGRGAEPRTFGLIVRTYDDGVAFSGMSTSGTGRSAGHAGAPTGDDRRLSQPPSRVV